MYTTRTASALALAFGLVACSDAPTAVSTPNDAGASAIAAPSSSSAERKARPAPATSVVNSPLTDAAGNIVGSFTGTIQLARVAVEGQSVIGSLLMNGTATVNGVTTDVTNVLGSGILATGGAAATAATTAAAAAPTAAAVGCSILDLTIGAIHLNLLGLDVALAQIDLDIVAVPGAGNLLGNLLCAIVGLLDGPTGGAVGGALTTLLGTINQLLSGLL
jgi:hypothetical protein